MDEILVKSVAHDMEPELGIVGGIINGRARYFLVDEYLSAELGNLTTSAIKTATLMLPGRLGLAAAVGVHALDSIKPAATIGEMIADGLLGGMKGLTMFSVFRLVGQKRMDAVNRGMLLGIAGRTLDLGLTRSTYFDKISNFDLFRGVKRLVSSSLDPVMLCTDATLAATGHAVFSRLKSTLSEGYLQRHPVLQHLVMSSSFGFSNGMYSELGRQTRHGEQFDGIKILRYAFLQSMFDATACVPGALYARKASDQTFRSLTKVQPTLERLGVGNFQCQDSSGRDANVQSSTTQPILYAAQQMGRRKGINPSLMTADTILLFSQDVLPVRGMLSVGRAEIGINLTRVEPSKCFGTLDHELTHFGRSMRKEALRRTDERLWRQTILESVLRTVGNGQVRFGRDNQGRLMQMRRLEVDEPTKEIIRDLLRRHETHETAGAPRTVDQILEELSLADPTSYQRVIRKVGIQRVKEELIGELDHLNQCRYACGFAQHVVGPRKTLLDFEIDRLSALYRSKPRLFLLDLERLLANASVDCSVFDKVGYRLFSREEFAARRSGFAEDLRCARAEYLDPRFPDRPLELRLDVIKRCNESLDMLRAERRLEQIVSLAQEPNQGRHRSKLRALSLDLLRLVGVHGYQSAPVFEYLLRCGLIELPELSVGQRLHFSAELRRVPYVAEGLAKLRKTSEAVSILGFDEASSRKIVQFDVPDGFTHVSQRKSRTLSLEPVTIGTVPVSGLFSDAKGHLYDSASKGTFRRFKHVLLVPDCLIDPLQPSDIQTIMQNPFRRADMRRWFSIAN